MTEYTDFRKQIENIQRLFRKEEYTAGARECIIAVEKTLRYILEKNPDSVSEEVQDKIKEAAKKRGRGEGIGGMTMGQIVHAMKETGFLEDWAKKNGSDTMFFRIIDQEKLTHLRNKFMHMGKEADRTESEFLFSSYRIVLKTFNLVNDEEMGAPLTKEEIGKLEDSDGNPKTESKPGSHQTIRIGGNARGSVFQSGDHNIVKMSHSNL